MEQVPLHGVAFVVVDLSSCVVVNQQNLQRCIDTALRASDLDAGSTPPLQTMFETLDRVFVAHVTSDPFVAELPGTSDLLWKLARSGYPTFGVGTLAPSVIAAVAKRFDWRLPFGVAEAAVPLWTAAADAAKMAGFPSAKVALISDDTWELAHAAREGCGFPIHVGGLEANELPDARILHAPSMTAVARLLSCRDSGRCRVARSREAVLAAI